MGDGTSLIPAVSQGIPVALRGHGLRDASPTCSSRSRRRRASRRWPTWPGSRSASPAASASSWVALQALLGSAGLTPDDVEVVTYPDFGHGVAVAEGQVDAAIGYLNNEPVQLALAEGRPSNVLRVDDVAPLPGPGLVVGRRTLERQARRPAGLHGGHAAGHGGHRGRPAAGPGRHVRARAGAGRGPRDAAGHPGGHRRRLAERLQPRRTAWAASIGRPGQSAVDIMTALPDSVVATPSAVDDLITDELLP